MQLKFSVPQYVHVQPVSAKYNSLYRDFPLKSLFLLFNI